MVFTVLVSHNPTMVRCYISNLKPNITDKWQVNVMVSRCWTTYNPATNRVLSFDLILSDEHGSSIHAKIPCYMMHLFTNRLEEGCVYRLHRFVVLPYETNYRPLRRDYFVQFTRVTSISPSMVQECLFTRYVFEFTAFNVLASRANDVKYLTDVIGVLREWGPVDTNSHSLQSCNRELRQIVISDELGKDLNISLWGQLALKYSDEDMKRIATNTVVVALTSCKVKLFQGTPVLSSTVSSQLYINLPLSICDIYKHILPLPVLLKSKAQKKQGLNVNSISDVYSFLKEGVPEGTMYNITGTIIDVDFTNDWKYIKCSTCRRSVDFNDHVYFCRGCNKNVTNPRIAYKIAVLIHDKDEEITCVLFDDAAIALLHISAEELQTRSLSEVDDPSWAKNYLLECLLCTSAILRIKIDGHNFAPHYSRRFTVSKYIGEYKTLVPKDNIMSTVAPCKYPRDDVYEDVEDEYAEFLAKITPYEMELADELFWGPHISSVSHVTATSSSVIDNEDETTSIISKPESTCDDEKVPTESTVECDPDHFRGKLRPRKNRTPQR